MDFQASEECNKTYATDRALPSVFCTHGAQKNDRHDLFDMSELSELQEAGSASKATAEGA
jgi:hypothetical protein